MRPHKLAVIEWARRTLQSNAVILDTETTGLDRYAEAIQLSIIDTQGNTLFDSLLRPVRPPAPESIRIHGLTADRLQLAPPLPEMIDTVRRLLTNRNVVIYNAAFDLRILAQSCEAHGLAGDWIRALAPHCDCLMQRYAIYHGERRKNGDYKWQSLPASDHTALGDAQATLALLQRIANTTTEKQTWTVRI